jgi:hypothetical protein
MEDATAKSLWEQLAIPVILMVLGGMATWVFNINADMAVIKKSVEKVDLITNDQRSAEKMLVLLEAQTKANTELVQEMKASQKELSEAVIQLRQAMTEMNTRAYDGPQRRR